MRDCRHLTFASAVLIVRGCGTVRSREVERLAARGVRSAAQLCAAVSPRWGCHVRGR